MNEQPSTGSRLKQLLQHGVIFGLTSSLQSALGFILLPLYTKYLDVEQFGVYSMLLIIAAACNTLFGLGASSALGRYYYDYEKEGKSKEIVSAALWLSFLGSVLLSILALATAYPVCNYYFNDTSLQLPYIIALVANSLSYPLTTFTLLLRYQKKSVFYFIVTIVGLLLNFGITMSLLIYSDIKICSPFIGMLATNILLLFVMMLFERHHITLKVPKGDYRIVLIFGLQVIASSFLSYIYECSDKVIMKEMLSLSDVGVYSLSGRIGTVFKLLVYLPFALIWAPLRMEYKDSPDNVSFVRKITNYYSLFGMLLILGCMVWGYDVLKVLFPQPEYAISLKLFPVCMVGFFFFGYMSIWDFGVFINNKLYYLSIIPVVCLVFNTSMNLWLLPTLGVEAAAYIFALTYVLSAFLLLFFSNKYYPIPMDWKRLFGIYAMWGVVFVCFFLIEMPITHTWWMKILVTVVIGGLTWHAFLTSNERRAIQAKINSFRND